MEAAFTHIALNLSRLERLVRFNLASSSMVAAWHCARYRATFFQYSASFIFSFDAAPGALMRLQP
jgi:hypothetical protein